MGKFALLLAGIASVSGAALNGTSVKQAISVYEVSNLTQYCCGHATDPVRFLVAKREHCDGSGWDHDFTFYAFSSEQPGTSEYCVGVSDLYGPTRSVLAKQDYCGGSGWTHAFTFFAYDHPVKGADEYCVGFTSLYGPDRGSLHKSSSCGGGGWTHKFNLYMYTKPGNRVTLTKQVLRSITYPDLNTLPPVAPTAISTRVYCNAADFKQQFGQDIITTKVTTGKERCFHWDVSTTGGFSYTVGTEISGGVPDIGEAKATASVTVNWGLTAGAGGNNCESTTKEDTQTFNYPVVTLPPKTVETYTFAQYQGRLTAVSFRATVDQYWSDGRITPTAISGTYQGVSYSSISQFFDNEHTVDSCTTELAAESGSEEDLLI